MPIHPTAIVDPHAEIAEDVEIQPFTIIGPHVRIGAGTIIGPHCCISGETTLGKNNRVYSNAQIGVPSQDLKDTSGERGKTVIGDNNIFRETVTISASTHYASDSEEKTTRIGSNCLFMACTHVAHDCHVGDGVIMANQSVLAGHVTVEPGVIIGGLVGIHQFCRIGQRAFIGGFTRAVQDVLPYMIIEGNPAKCYGPNTIGLKRAGMSLETIKAIKLSYRLLYRSGLNRTQAVARIVQEVSDLPERAVLLEFISRSERGLI
ncbi:MAG: acyl-ACP--UDP-N-acetylglucosamine O-acyltransferase [Candidatus Hydrogenedentes bacterium]|nr:acyl-ACP--UDP-N-acetylglucosamine O-acyltransferase [Candidatus Hydrogenedentota bacterium]